MAIEPINQSGDIDTRPQVLIAKINEIIEATNVLVSIEAQRQMDALNAAEASDELEAQALDEAHDN